MLDDIQRVVVAVDNQSQGWPENVEFVDAAVVDEDCVALYLLLARTISLVGAR